MIKTALVFSLVLLPLASEAAYKVYLKNGSVISGVKSYEKHDGEILILFEGGSIGVPQNDIQKIQETETPEQDFRFKQTPETGTGKTDQGSPAAEPQAAGRDSNALRAELDSVNEELKTLDEDEARVKASINEKRGSRLRYTNVQLRQIEKEIEPLQQELNSIQQKKSNLTQRKAQLEGELRRTE
jgi:predicted RNase H-like nuclease (RuvC/YqgF family)